MRELLPILAAGVLLSSSAASGQTQPRQQEQQQQDQRRPPPTIVATPLALAIAGFDGDGDRLVGREEYEAGVSRSFSQGDRDGDGFLGLIEFTSWSEATLGNPGTLPGPFDFDRDGDDRVSRAEFERLFAARWEAMDRDRNDVLARSELVTAVSVPDFRDRRRRRRD